MDSQIVSSQATALPLTSKPLILVVDDRPENLEAMQALLGDDEDWHLRCAASGEEALRCLLQEDISLVLLDVQMPDMDGYEVAQLMRGNPGTRHTPIIFISAIVHNQDSILRGYSRGAVDFILKPFDSLVLRQKIHNFLAYESNRRALLNLSRELERAHAFNASILTNAAEGIMVVGEDGLIQYANPAMAEMVGTTSEDLQGRSFLKLLESSNEPENWKETPFYHHWQRGKIYRLHEVTLLKQLGEGSSETKTALVVNHPVIQVSLSCAPLPHPQRAMVMIIRDIAVEHDLRQKLEALIISDPLTGLYNRRGFYQAVETALARAKRTKTHLAIIYIDLDGFKNINDSMGHDVGDDLLRHVATQLKSAIRPYDSLARMGGDEFTIVLDSLAELRDATQIADKLLKLISAPFCVGEEEFAISASVGIACYPEGGEDVEDLLRAADMAMYEAKKNGRQHYRFHSPQMTQRVHARLTLEKRLRQAVENQHFTLVYQPQYYLGSGRLRGFEALLRWTKGNPDNLTPDQFIARLEETRLINPLGQWIFNEGIARLADINRQFGSHVMLSLNVSPIQFALPNLVDGIEQQLHTYQVTTNQLELEVTEGILMRNIETTRAHLGQLHEMGVKVAVDDFGTGYSSLAYLRQFKLDALKIDRLFVANMLDFARDAAVVSTIIDLGRHLDLEVIAEGVETQNQHEWLQHNNCTIMQGYLASPPLSFEQAMQLPIQLPIGLPQLVS